MESLHASFQGVMPVAINPKDRDFGLPFLGNWGESALENNVVWRLNKINIKILLFN
jgi:hypothetical protein